MKSDEKQRYHHGQLRAALLQAAEAELEEAGIEAFSLRKVAKRAGVSHAAPAHHFGDATGLLTGLAEIGYRRFVDYMVARETQDDHWTRAVRAGLGYIAFAQENPALFRLIFSSSRPNYDDPALGEAASASFQHLLGLVAAPGVECPGEDPTTLTDAFALWSATHGIADLLISQQAFPLDRITGQDHETTCAAILRRSLERTLG